MVDIGVQKDVVLDDKGNVIEKQEEEQTQEEGGDARLTEDHHEDQDEHEEEHASDGESEEEAEERRQRNRARRQDNKARRKDYIESLRREIAARDEVLNQQAQRLEALERRTHGADMSAVDAELKKSVDSYNYYKAIHADAVTRADGPIATDAQEKMFTAMQRAQQLQSVKQAAVTKPQQPQPLDPRLKAQAEVWLERNSWYDPTGADPDSAIALTVDQRMASEGWNPTTSQYWEELDSRLKRYLPHRYNSGYTNGKKGASRSPVAGSGREGASSNSSGGYTLSAERVQALKDAGMWEDPKNRADAIKRFQEYDKANKGAR